MSRTSPTLMLAYLSRQSGRNLRVGRMKRHLATGVSLRPTPRLFEVLLAITLLLGASRTGANAQPSALSASQTASKPMPQSASAVTQPVMPLEIATSGHARQPAWTSYDKPLTVAQLVRVAIEVNPQVKAAKQQWEASQHQILQNYAPADPVFTYGHLGSDHDFNAAEHSHAISMTFQFPGEALLQAEEARRTADIARLTYEAAVRDLRAGVETAYYQVVLDDGLIEVNRQNIVNLRQVVSVTQAQYTGGQAQQSDLIGAELALDQAVLQQRQHEINRLNDRSTLNGLLFRRADSPLNLVQRIELQPLQIKLNQVLGRATHARQEILEAALTANNSNTSLKLAQMEYLPNYNVSGEYDLLLAPGYRPLPKVGKGWVWTFGFNIPVFFWIHQREDVFSAQHSLQASRYSFDSVFHQTEISATQLYQSAQYAYESAQVYRGQLIPLADKQFKVALVAYQSGKVDFLTLSSALQCDYASRLTYLQNANSYFAGEVALEQAMGVSFQQ